MKSDNCLVKSPAVCVPVCVGRSEELRPAAERAAALADVVELRLDCLEPSELDGALGEIESLLQSPHTFIFTLRHTGQGGVRAHADDARRAFRARLRGLLAAAGAPKRHFVDLEFDDPAARALVKDFAACARVICSQHDFEGVSADLDQLYERMDATGADALKIAVTARDATDCLPVFRLLARARREGRPLVALAMGEAGKVTRVLGPSRGSLLTYAASAASHETAPGQLTAEELRGLYRVDEIDDETRVAGLVGSPVAHSLSPHMHNAAFRALGLRAVYLPFEVRDIDAFMRRMVNPRTREMKWPLIGLSVTAPHKGSVIEHLDHVDDAAREIGAVNTVVVRGGELHGYNTDAAASLDALGGVELRGARVAVIGAGGAARALLWSLRERGARATVYARDAARAREVAAAFGADASPLDGARFDGYEVVVNATPLGTRGRNEHSTPAAAAQLRGARLAYDLVYNPPTTRFMREAADAGCDTAGGLPMLVAQAAEQFRLWTGAQPPASQMRAAALKAEKAEVRG
jgi:3-dehydroquinate dehydratase/shikimate dehydrogenase